jgi:hypothetical protein
MPIKQQYQAVLTRPAAIQTKPKLLLNFSNYIRASSLRIFPVCGLRHLSTAFSLKENAAPRTASMFQNRSGGEL